MTPSIKRGRSRQRIAERRNQRIASARLAEMYAEMFSLPPWYVVAAIPLLALGIASIIAVLIERGVF